MTKPFRSIFVFSPVFPWTDLTAETHLLPRPEPQLKAVFPLGKLGLPNKERATATHRVTYFQHTSWNLSSYTNTGLEELYGNGETMLWNINSLKDLKIPKFNCVFLVQQKYDEISSSAVFFL